MLPPLRKSSESRFSFVIAYKAENYSRTKGKSLTTQFLLWGADKSLLCFSFLQCVLLLKIWIEQGIEWKTCIYFPWNLDLNMIVSNLFILLDVKAGDLVNSVSKVGPVRLNILKYCFDVCQTWIRRPGRSPPVGHHQIFENW